jgi:hypothetical protein
MQFAADLQRAARRKRGQKQKVQAASSLHFP